MTVSSSSVPSCSKSCTVSRCGWQVMFCSWDTRTGALRWPWGRGHAGGQAWAGHPACEVGLSEQASGCPGHRGPLRAPLLRGPRLSQLGGSVGRWRTLGPCVWGGGTEAPGGLVPALPCLGAGDGTGRGASAFGSHRRWEAPTSLVQCTMSSQRNCSPGNFSLNCFSATWGTRRWGWFIKAASTSATPPEPARTSHGAACSTALEILWGSKWGGGDPTSAWAPSLARVLDMPCPRMDRVLPAATDSRGGSRWALAGPPPPWPYLQGAGVTIDQQTEDGDLDAASACGQSTVRSALVPGTWWGGLAPPCGAATCSDHQPPTFSEQTLAQRLFLAKCGLRGAYRTHQPLRLGTVVAPHSHFHKKERL